MKTKDNKEIVVCGHPHRLDLLEEAVSLVDTKDRSYMMETVDLNRVIGKDHYVKTEKGDTCFFMERGNRGYKTRFVLNKDAPDTTKITVGIAMGDASDGPLEGKYILFTLFEGELAPKEPSDPRLKDEEREESEKAWATHALVPTEAELQQAKELGII